MYSLPGTVYLTGAGPGDPELLTRRAATLLAEAGSVLHDDLVSGEVLALAGPNAEVINVGKRCGHKAITQQGINEMMIARAGSGEVVVRLKSGDPLLFGRAGEEIRALIAAKIPFVVVPGISAAFAAAAAAGLTLTDRGGASRLVFASGHHAHDGRKEEWSSTAGTTLARYMPGKDYAAIQAELLADGWPAKTPCLVVSNASWKSQIVRGTTLDALSVIEPLPAPAILLAGESLASFSAATNAAPHTSERLS
uniref:uroporphyrinogen-III C-methyltransferase n=1 Tax=mine drainage metagenome TaxID=410659 RepID=E6PXF0_9ZZZZ